MDFVLGGLRAVASHLEEILHTEQIKIYHELLEILQEFGRGEIFDLFLKRKNFYSKRRVRECISIYRYHKPIIKIYKESKIFLDRYKNYPLYIVTDGNKKVQAHKIKNLNLDPYFKKILITHRYGIKKSKPSLYCFNLIKKIENCNWEKIVYIGDNPAKDFVSLKRVNAKTVRLLKGNYAKDYVKDEFEADERINSLNELPKILKKFFK